MDEKDELNVYKKSNICVSIMAAIIVIYEMINSSVDNSVVSLSTMWLAVESLSTYKYNKKKIKLICGMLWLVISILCFVLIFLEDK